MPSYNSSNKEKYRSGSCRLIGNNIHKKKEDLHLHHLQIKMTSRSQDSICLNGWVQMSIQVQSCFGQGPDYYSDGFSVSKK